MANLTFAESIFIARSPDDLYDMVSDVTRMGEWSPVCKACGGTKVPGQSQERGSAVGMNYPLGHGRPSRRSSSPIVGREFAFIVGGDRVRWGYEFVPSLGGTMVTESWEFLPGGQTFFEERFGEDAPAQVAARAEEARTGIPVTLAALKAAAEAE